MPKQTLFEYLGIAAQERIHSQTLAWLLTPNASPLEPASRVALLKALGLKCTQQNVVELRVQTELDSLDLVCASSEVFLVVENKLKSRQSSLQLRSYDAKIEKVAELLGSTATAHKVFLTLSRERSGCGWTDVDYADLVQPLTAAATASNNPYVHDYAALLSHLVHARDTFIDNPGAYPEVHKRVSWSAAKRLQVKLPDEISTIESFICTNRLERIFVETLLRNLVANVPNAMSDAGASGRPLVQVPLWLVQITVGEWYRAGLQLQDKTLKLNIADLDYESSTLGSGLTMFDPLLIGGEKKRKVYSGTARDYRSWVWDAPQILTSIAPPGAGFARAFVAEVSAATCAWKQALQVLLARKQLVDFETWTPERASALLAARRASREASKRDSRKKLSQTLKNYADGPNE